MLWNPSPSWYRWDKCELVPASHRTPLIENYGSRIQHQLCWTFLRLHNSLGCSHPSHLSSCLHTCSDVPFGCPASPSALLIFTHRHFLQWTSYTFIPTLVLTFQTTWNNRLLNQQWWITGRFPVDHFQKAWGSLTYGIPSKWSDNECIIIIPSFRVENYMKSNWILR